MPGQVICFPRLARRVRRPVARWATGQDGRLACRWHVDEEPPSRH